MTEGEPAAGDLPLGLPAVIVGLDALPVSFAFVRSLQRRRS